MKKIVVLIISCMLIGCSANKEEKKQSLSIVTTSFIGYDIATQIVGDKGEVLNILPWGSELHDFEPTPKDMNAVNEADMFIYLSDELEPWIKNNSENENAFNLSKNYPLEEKQNSTNVHFWCDPVVYMRLIKNTQEYITSLDSKNKDYYETRANAYIDEIASLHEKFETYMQTVEKPTIYFAGHNAMDAFAKRYHLTITSLSDEFRPDADVSAKQIETLSNNIEASKTHYLFCEELVEQRIAKQIASSFKNKDYQLTILELHSYHNISKKQSEENVTYANLYKQNINNIKQALSN